MGRGGGGGGGGGSIYVDKRGRAPGEYERARPLCNSYSVLRPLLPQPHLSFNLA